MQCKTEHRCITGFSNGQFNSRRPDLGDASPSRHTPSPGTGLGILDLLGYPMGQAMQPWVQRATQYPNPPTKMCCRAMPYNVTQIYDAWYRPRPYCPTLVELQCSRTKLRAKMYPHADDTL